MHRIHGGLAVVVPVQRGKSQKLRKVLRNINGMETVTASPFKVSSTTLFVTGVIVPEQDYHGKPLPETFVFATTYCGPRNKHFEDLLATNKDNLWSMFQYCKGFPNKQHVDDETLLAYLKKYNRLGNFSSRYNFLGKKDVEREKDLRYQIEQYIDKAQALHAFDKLSSMQIQTLIQRYIRAMGPDYDWALKADRKNIWELLYLARAYAALLLTVGGVLLFLLFLVPLSWYIGRIKTPAADRPPDRRVRMLAATQLNPTLNGMVAAAPLKPGMLRRWFYAVSLRVSGSFAAVFSKVPTVSSIRWLTIDKKRRLFFLSNYSNTTDFYVRDFINGNTARGVNFMFTHGMGFPDANPFFGGGIKVDPEGYMNAVHAGQHVVDLWYAHDKSMVVDIILKNRKIRNGLPKKMTEQKAVEWLRLL